jgi:hypothetical protein
MKLLLKGYHRRVCVSMHMYLWVCGVCVRVCVCLCVCNVCVSDQLCVHMCVCLIKCVRTCIGSSNSDVGSLF